LRSRVVYVPDDVVFVEDLSPPLSGQVDHQRQVQARQNARRARGAVLQNRTLGPYLAAIDTILVSAMTLGGLTVVQPCSVGRHFDVDNCSTQSTNVAVFHHRCFNPRDSVDFVGSQPKIWESTGPGGLPW
jgi:hypothetical protein